MARHGRAWQRLVWFGLVWFGLDAQPTHRDRVDGEKKRVVDFLLEGLSLSGRQACFVVVVDGRSLKWRHPCHAQHLEDPSGMEEDLHRG
jgi:hypothetical protein